MGWRRDMPPSKWDLDWDPHSPYDTLLCSVPRGSLDEIVWMEGNTSLLQDRRTSFLCIHIFSLDLLITLISVLIKLLLLACKCQKPKLNYLIQKENLFYHVTKNKTKQNRLASCKVEFDTQTLSSAICFSPSLLFLLLHGLHSQVFSHMEPRLAASPCRLIILPYVSTKEPQWK